MFCQCTVVALGAHMTVLIRATSGDGVQGVVLDGGETGQAPAMLLEQRCKDQDGMTSKANRSTI